MENQNQRSNEETEIDLVELFLGTLEKASADDCGGTVYSTSGLWGKQISDDAHVSVCNKNLYSEQTGQ